MGENQWKERLERCERILIGLGEEWKLCKGQEERKEQVLKGYEVLYQWVKNKDYFIITMATDGVIFDTLLGSSQEVVVSQKEEWEEGLACKEADLEMLARMDQVFPKKEIQQDTRWQRIVAPCGNETWQQCSRACTKDIWEPGEIPSGICPHCGALLIGNTIDAPVYIEEGYLPQWQRYTQWLAGTLNRDTVILELGVGFNQPGMVRFPFEKTAYFNQKAFLCRVNGKFPQVPKELEGRTEGFLGDSVKWVLEGV